MFRAACALAVACFTASPAGAQIDGFEREPINYKTAQAENALPDTIRIHLLSTEIGGRIEEG